MSEQLAVVLRVFPPTRYPLQTQHRYFLLLTLPHPKHTSSALPAMTRSSHSFAGAFRFTLFAISATLLVVPFIAHQVAAVWKPYEGFSEPPGLTVRSYDGMKERDYQCQNENGGIAGVSKYPRDRYFVDWTPLANSLGKQSIAWRISELSSHVENSCVPSLI